MRAFGFFPTVFHFSGIGIIIINSGFIFFDPAESPNFLLIRVGKYDVTVTYMKLARFFFFSSLEKFSD